MELPLKLLVLGDFTNRVDSSRVEDREPINIDKDTFNEVLKSQDIELQMSVKNTLSEDTDAEMNIALKFESIKDFEPEAVAKKVPALQELLKIREALMTLKSPLSNIPEFRREIQNVIKDDNKREQLFKELGINEEKGE